MPLEAPALLGLGAAVLVGAATQRVTSLGFALVASPFLVLVLGPFTGVLLINVLGSIAAALVLVAVRRDVDVRHALLLAAPAVVAVLPGAWIARHSPQAVLQTVVGGCVVVALLVVLGVGRRRSAGTIAENSGTPSRRRRPGALIAGGASGLMGSLAGVGGPAVTVYAVATRWPQASFAATAQLLFCIVGAVSVAAKGLPSLPVYGWVTAGSALAAGLVIGELLQSRVSAARGRQAAIGLALVGGTATLVGGILQF